MSDVELPDNLRIQIAVKVLGYVARRIEPEWYGRPVWLFFAPSDPNYIVYSWDENACNAMMFRDGKTEASGYAEPLPFYDSDLNEALSEVVGSLRQRGAETMERFDELMRLQYPPIWVLDNEDAAAAVCRAALKAIES